MGSGKTINTKTTSGATGGGGQVKVTVGRGKDITYQADQSFINFDVHEYTKDIFKQGDILQQKVQQTVMQSEEDMHKVNVGSLALRIA